MLPNTMNIIVNEAEKSSHSFFRHGAISLYKNKILTKGHNQCLNKDIIFTSMHAEMSVIQQLKRMNLNLKKIKKLTIVVIRINKNGLLRQSKPCNKCQHIMKRYGIKKCIYSNEDGKLDIMFF